VAEVRNSETETNEECLANSRVGRIKGSVRSTLAKDEESVCLSNVSEEQARDHHKNQKVKSACF
jgi:hypothetical protein